jgi:hypothetical protein
MRLRLIFTLGLVLLLSTFASSNECARYGRKAGVCTGPTPVGQQVSHEEYSTLIINKLLYI